MNHHLTRDEFAALEEVRNAQSAPRGAKPAKHSACVARNGKRLVGIKFLSYRKDGTYALTENGTEALFINSCIAGLRALANDEQTKLDDEVTTFLIRKGHIAESAVAGRFAVTEKGRECLADIALNP